VREGCTRSRTNPHNPGEIATDASQGICRELGTDNWHANGGGRRTTLEPRRPSRTENDPLMPHRATSHGWRRRAEDKRAYEPALAHLYGYSPEQMRNVKSIGAGSCRLYVTGHPPTRTCAISISMGTPPPAPWAVQWAHTRTRSPLTRTHAGVPVALPQSRAVGRASAPSRGRSEPRPLPGSSAGKARARGVERSVVVERRLARRRHALVVARGTTHTASSRDTQRDARGVHDPRPGRAYARIL
jgi:hypothetical protein